MEVLRRTHGSLKKIAGAFIRTRWQEWTQLAHRLLPQQMPASTAVVSCVRGRYSCGLFWGTYPHSVSGWCAQAATFAAGTTRCSEGKPCAE